MYISEAEARRLSRGGHGSTVPHPPECICTICTCGAHKCPPDRVQGRYHNLKSSYMEDFRGEYQQPERINRPQYIHRPRPFEGTTTNQEDFAYRGMPERRKLAVLKDNGLGGQGLPFEGVTTNQHDFRKWNSRPAEPTIKQNSRAFIVPDDRNFESEFGAQFVPKAGGQRRSRAPANRQTQSLPFQGETTNQADFQEWNSRPARSFGQTSTYRPRVDDRDFLTEGRSEYTQKPFDHCPAIEVGVSSKPHNGHVLVEKLGDRWCHTTHPQEWDRTQQAMPAAF